jgi:hypothetical protein
MNETTQNAITEAQAADHTAGLNEVTGQPTAHAGHGVGDYQDDCAACRQQVELADKVIAEVIAEEKAASQVSHSEQQARAQMDSIVEMVAGLNPEECDTCNCWHPANFEGDCRDDDNRFATEDGCREKAQETIEQDALSVEIRSGWYTPGSEPENRQPEEYCILLCTGGPAVRIIGELDGGQPYTARLEHQDWFTPWQELMEVDHDALLAYARVFYYGQ